MTPIEPQHEHEPRHRADQSHPLAGQAVEVHFDGGNFYLPGSESLQAIYTFVIEDWWDTLAGISWIYSSHSADAAYYAVRSGQSANLPWDDEVLYGKIDGVGLLIHASEIIPTGKTL